MMPSPLNQHVARSDADTDSTAARPLLTDAAASEPHHLMRATDAANSPISNGVCDSKMPPTMKDLTSASEDMESMEMELLHDIPDIEIAR